MPPFLLPTQSQLLWSTIRTIQYLGAAHLLWEYGYNIRFTRGPSMLPTLEVEDDVVLVSNLHRYGRGVSVGDLVAFKIPFNRDEAIKRVLGLPGDYVMIDTPESGSEAMIQVPAGHCWVVGDNLPDSRDSRFYGPLPLALIKGKVIAKTRPLREFKWIENTLKSPEDR